MFTLIIGKSSSKNFKKVLEISQTLGGYYDGNQIAIEVKELSSAYELLKPVFKYHIATWGNTKAYYNGIEVNPYTYPLKAYLKKNMDITAIFSQLDTLDSDIPGAYDISKMSFEYYKRVENRFFFKNEYYSFGD